MGLSSPLKQETNLFSYTTVYDKNLFYRLLLKTIQNVLDFPNFYDERDQGRTSER